MHSWKYYFEEKSVLQMFYEEGNAFSMFVTSQRDSALWETLCKHQFYKKTPQGTFNLRWNYSSASKTKSLNITELNWLKISKDLSYKAKEMSRYLPKANGFWSIFIFSLIGFQCFAEIPVMAHWPGKSMWKLLILFNKSNTIWLENEETSKSRQMYYVKQGGGS